MTEPVNQSSVYDAKMKAVLAVIIVLGFFGVITGLFFVKDISSSVKDVLLVMFGALIASYKEVTGYFLGSSSGSARKGDVIAAAQTASALADKQPVDVKIDTSAAPVSVKEQK